MKPLALLTLLTLLLAGCSGSSKQRIECEGPLQTLAPTFPYADPAPWPEGRVVERIDIVSADSSNALPAETVSAVREVLSSAVGQAVDGEEIRWDMARILQLDAFEDVYAEVDGAVLRYTLSERRQIRGVRVEGLPEDSPSRERIEAVSGETYRPSDLFTLAELTLTELYEQGHRDATLQVLGRSAAEEGAVDVCFFAEPGRVWRIDEMRVTGASQIRADDILALIHTSEGALNTQGGLYREEQLREDLMRVQGRYMDEGMVMVRLNTEARWEEEALVVELIVDEGPRFTMGDLTITGSPSVSLPEYLEQLEWSAGDVYSHTTLMGDVERIRAIEKQAGSDAEVSISTQLDTALNRVNVEVMIP